MRTTPLTALLCVLLCSPLHLSAATAANAAPGSAHDHAPAEVPLISGTVAETMDSGGYTYVFLKEGKTSQWVATPPMKVKKGQRLTLQSGMVMKNFKSNSLKRTFPSIIFSGGPASAAPAGHGSALPAGHDGSMPPGHDMPGAGDSRGGAPSMGMAHGAKASPLQAGVKVEKAPGPDGFTVSELYAKKKELDGKQVSVRGKVVKVAQGIMDKNWVHLQDGTGDAKKGTHDLTLTTTEVPEVGEVAVFKGTAKKDQDIGMGYHYEVLVEKASRVK